ncbi:hypothetical protein RB595_010504 [Gaeumannomyces hyphopodioides]
MSRGTDSRKPLKTTIHNLVDEWDWRLRIGPNWGEKTARSAEIRQAFVGSVWDEVKHEYDKMLEDLKAYFEGCLKAQAISAELQGRVKDIESIKKTLVRRESIKLFASIRDVFQEMHDLVGLRIVPLNEPSREKAQKFIDGFQMAKESVHISADRKVGEYWDVRFGAYESDNHRLAIGQHGRLAPYDGVMFEVQVTTWAKKIYNILAHPLLYKTMHGDLSKAVEGMVDTIGGMTSTLETQLSTLRTAITQMLEEKAAVAESAPDANLNEIKGAKEAALAKLGKLDKGIRKAVENAFSGVIDSLETQTPNGTSVAHYLKTKAAEQCGILGGEWEENRSRQELDKTLDYKKSLARQEAARAQEHEESPQRQEAQGAQQRRTFLTEWERTADEDRFKTRWLELCEKLQNTFCYQYSKDRNPERAAGTCEWFTSHTSFHTWLGSNTSSLLWVSAGAGCGKSVLAKYLVDEMLMPEDLGSRIICYFFFGDEFEGQKSAHAALCCILHQIFTQGPHLLTAEILGRFERHGPRVFGSFRDLWAILVDVLQQACEIICVLDGLDGCESEGLRRITKALRDFYGPSNLNHGSAVGRIDMELEGRLKFLLTSRPEAYIQKDIQFFQGTSGNRYPSFYLNAENKPEADQIEREIEIVIDNIANDITEEQFLDPDQTEILVKELTRVPNRTYFWLHLMHEQLRNWAGGMTPNALQDTLKKIPKTASEAYNKMLSRSPDRGETNQLLHILAAAWRPLSLKELAVAWAVHYNTLQDDNWLENNSPPFPAEAIRPASEEQTQLTIRRLCGSVVMIVDKKVYFLHETVREFLIKEDQHQHDSGPITPADNAPDNSSNGSWDSCLRITDSHDLLGTICVKYLGSHDFSQCSVGDLDRIYSSLALFGYSALYWRRHGDSIHRKKYMSAVVEQGDENFWMFASRKPGSQEEMKKLKAELEAKMEKAEESRKKMKEALRNRAKEPQEEVKRLMAELGARMVKAEEDRKKMNEALRNRVKEPQEEVKKLMAELGKGMKEAQRSRDKEPQEEVKKLMAELGGKMEKAEENRKKMKEALRNRVKESQEAAKKSTAELEAKIEKAEEDGKIIQLNFEESWKG